MESSPQRCGRVSPSSLFPRSILHLYHALGKIIEHLLLIHHRDL
jgi:hypothetical protein